MSKVIHIPWTKCTATNTAIKCEVDRLFTSTSQDRATRQWIPFWTISSHNGMNIGFTDERLIEKWDSKYDAELLQDWK
jgi:hypothetical protein